MIILVGASASGKTEVAKAIIKKYGYKKLVTTTTRKKRNGEVDDVDYHFIDTVEFEKRIENDEFLEYVKYADNYYGTNKKDVSLDKVLIVEPNGANAIYSKLKDEVVIFLLEASVDERIKRMKKREDDEESIRRRIEVDEINFKEELLDHIDFIINTDHVKVDEVADEVYTSYKSMMEIR